MADFSKLNRKEIYPQQYSVKHDPVNGSYKILDLWHPYLDNFADIDKDLPDGAPCIKVISSGEVGALVNALREQGVLQRFYKSDVSEKTDAREVVIKEVPVESKKSEQFMLKEKGIDSILRIIGIDSVQQVGK